MLSSGLFDIIPDRQVVIQVVVVGVITYWTLWICYARCFHPLSRYPGPFWASVSRIWTVVHVLIGNAEAAQKVLHARYGPVVRIAPNELIINDPHDFYLSFRAPFSRYPDHFTSTDEKIHAKRRRNVSHVYTMTSILQSEKYLNECTAVFLEQLGKIAENKDTFDLHEWVRMYAYDVIGEHYFSKMFGFLKSGNDHLGFMGSTDTLVPVMTLSGVMPAYIRPLFMFAGFLFPRVRNALTALGKSNKAAETAVQDHLTERDKNRDGQRRADVLNKVLDIYFDSSEKADFDLDDVRLEAFGAFLAGSDTTAIFISATLYHIIKNRDVYDRLTKEIDQGTKEGLFSTPFITYNEAVKLHYLSACIKEGMRVHPSTALPFPRNAPKGGCDIAGHWVPETARVGVNAAVVQFDKSIFGDDADVFNPLRWIEGDTDKMNRYILQFGAGSWTCMGKHISMTEIYKIVPELLRSYHFELDDPRPMTTTSYWFYKPGPIKTRVTKRHPDIQA
ncbi:cytochrome P450 [Aspergillus ambiguus]|uniref:cytochrome P450 n=1 Tax=Aspergillus ambiguus TaxID=176160 RepID=UPI003CCD42BC